MVLLLIAPLVLVLFSLAIMPLIAANKWKIIEPYFFIVISIISIILDFVYIPTAKNMLLHIIVHDYLPFIIMLFTLYTISHGLNIQLKITPTTFNNVIFLFIGSILSSLIGTTGAAILLINPYLKLNSNRKTKQHLVLFFIITIANVGGLLTPLGDPPLLLGYLHGISFDWLFTHMLKYWVGYIILILSIFSIIDKYILSRDQDQINKVITPKIKIDGLINLILIICTALILFFDLKYIKNILLLIFSYLSIKKNKDKVDYHPFIEVVQVFLVIFIVLAPVLYLMQINSNAIHNFLHKISSNLPLAYFSLCSAASAYLDNAPSYLLFVKMTGLHSNDLMTIGSPLLVAISVSAVVMGSLTYIGNAPNIMVRNIAMKKNVQMPSFLAYSGYSMAIIIPISYILIKLFNFS